MAEDVSLVFGVAGGSKVDGASGAEIKRQIRELTNNINNSKTTAGRQLKFGVLKGETEKLLKDDLQSIISNINSGKNGLKLTVGKIDATSAISQLKAELNAMLSTIKVDTGFTVTLGSNGVTTAVKEMISDASQATMSLNQVKAALDEIGLTSKNIQSSYASLQKSLASAPSSNDNTASLKNLREQYVALKSAITDVEGKQTQASTTEIQAIHKQQDALQSLIRTTEDRLKGEQAATQASVSNMKATEAEASKLLKTLNADQTKLASTIGGLGNNVSGSVLASLKSDFDTLSDKIKQAETAEGNRSKSALQGLILEQSALKALIRDEQILEAQSKTASAETVGNLKTILSVQKELEKSSAALQDGYLKTSGSEGLEKIKAQYTELNTLIEKLKTSGGEDTTGLISQITGSQTSLQGLISNLKAAEAEANKMSSSVVGGLKAIDTLMSGLDKSMKGDFLKVVGDAELQELNRGYANLCVSVEDLRQKRNAASAEEISNVQDQITVFQTLIRTKEESVKLLKDVNATQSQLGTSVGGLDNTTDKAKLAEITRLYNDVALAVKNLDNVETAAAQESLIELSAKQTTLQSLIREYQNLTIAANTSSSEVMGQFNTLKSLQQKLDSDFKSIQVASGFEGGAAQLNEITAAMDKLNSEYQKLTTRGKIEVGDLTGLRTQQQTVRDLITGTNEWIATQKRNEEASRSMTASVKGDYETLKAMQASLTADVKKMEKSLVSDADLAAFGEMKSRLSEITVLLDRLKASNSNSFIGDVINTTSQIDRQQTSLRTLIHSTQERVAEEKRVAAEVAKIAAAEEKMAAKAAIAANNIRAMGSEATVLQKKMTAALTNFSKASGTDFYRSIAAGKEELDKMLMNVANLDRDKLNALTDEFIRCEGQIRSANLASKSFGETLSNNAKKFASWFGMTQVITYSIRYMRQMLTNVIAIDTAMTSLKRVTNETNTAYSRFLTDSISRSKVLGSSIADVVSATADFSRLGYSMADASGLADAALVYKNVGDGIDNITDASASVISTMQAFKIEASEAMSIVDRFNEVGNNFAISAQGVGDALLNSASALVSGNNTLNESIALITSANTVVQDAEKVGTVLKTVSMYLRAAKTEAEDAGESTDGMAESVSELRGELLALTGGKVDIQIDANTFKSTYQIIEELSQVWGELTDITQANILEMVGGKRNSNVVAALIEGFDIAQDVMESAANSAGSALAENEQYLESIAGKITLLQASFEGLSWNFIDSKLVKLTVEFMTALTDVVSVLAQADVLIPSILSAITIYKAMSVTRAAALFSSQEAASTAMLVSRLVAEKQTTDTLITSYVMLNAEKQKTVLSQLDLAVSTGALTATQRTQIANNLTQASSARAAALATTGLTAATTGLTSSIKALFKANRVGWVLTAIAMIYPVVERLFDFASNKNDRLIQEAEDLKTAYSDAANQINGNLNTLSSLESEFATLSKGVGEYGENISLAASDYERYKDIVATILDLNPSLITGYDAEGTAIANKNGLLEQSIELLKEEQNLKLQGITSKDSIVTLGISAAVQMEEFESEAANVQRTLSTLKKGFINSVNGYMGEDWQNNTQEDIFKALGIDSGGKADVHSLIADHYDEIIAAVKDGESELFQLLGRENSLALVALADQYEQELFAYTKRMDEMASGLNSSLQLVPQTLDSYGELTNGQKDFLTQYIDNFRIVDRTEAEFARMREDVLAFTEFLADEKDLEHIIEVGIALKSTIDLEGNDLTVREYLDGLEQLKADVENYAENEEVYAVLKGFFGLELEEGEVTTEVTEATKRVKSKLTDECKDLIDGLDAKHVIELDKMLSVAGYEVTLERLQQMLRHLYIDFGNTIDTLDFTGLADGLGDVESKFSNLVSAMDTLREGTSLTVGELSKLALEYPKLLEQSSLFTDTSIENQYALLDAILGTYEAEYDGLIETKIAELEATKAVLEAQLEMENQKADIVLQIAALQANGQLETEEDYQNLLAELKLLEGENYVTFANGMISVNADMLNQELDNKSDQIEASVPLFEAQGELTAEANKEGLDASLKYYTAFVSSLAAWGQNQLNPTLRTISESISSALEGDGVTGIADASYDFNLNVTKGEIQLLYDAFVKEVGADASITLTTSFEDVFKIDGQNVSDWSSYYSGVIAERQQVIKKEIDSIDITIKNLEHLKGLDLTSLYKSPTSSSSGSGSGSDGSGSGTSANTELVEEYIVDIDKYREALENLSRVQIQKTELELVLSNTDDLREQIDLMNQLVDIYGEEQAAQWELNELYKDTLNVTAEALTQMGFEVDFDPSSAKFYVENWELVNELVADTAEGYDSIEEATNALRQSLEDTHDSALAINDELQNGITNMVDLAYAAREMKIATIDNLHAVVENASSAVDGIQEVYETLTSVIKERNDNSGLISLDSLQSVVDIGIEYLKYLEDENGLLEVNQVSIQKLMAVKTEQLAIEAALSYVERLRLASLDGSIESLEEITLANADAATSTWDLVYANLALANLPENVYEEQLKNIQALQALAVGAVGSIGVTGGQSFLEEYIVQIEDYRASLERLSQVEIKKTSIELEISNTDDLEKRVELQGELVRVYEEEAYVLQELNGLRDETIAAGVSELEDLGFEIDFDPDSNKLFIRNLELINSLTGETQEETNELREAIEQKIEALESLNQANQEGTASWEAAIYAIRQAKIAIVDDLKSIVVAASDAVDEIQNVYDALKTAADEWAEFDGFISVDAFQAIVELGPEYMQYLEDANGYLVISEENINKVTAAKVEQLAVDSALSYVERLKLALYDDSVEDLNQILFATQETTASTWDLVYANLALLDLNSEQYEAALHNINALRSLSMAAVDSIGKATDSLTDSLTDMQDGMDDILKYVMDMLKHQVNQQIDALEDMKDAYAELIALKKEYIQTTEDEKDYQEEVAEKIEEIAVLQEKINLLMLDDSREAQAKRIALEEEMADLQNDLADLQADYATDAKLDSLDAMQEAYEEQKDKEIEVLEDSISSEQKLYDMAIEYIKNNWDTLYDELIAWNYEYGTVLNSEITSAWDNCLLAAERYGSYLDALIGLQEELNDLANDTYSNNTVVGGSVGSDTGYSSSGGQGTGSSGSSSSTFTPTDTSTGTSSDSSSDSSSGSSLTTAEAVERVANHIKSMYDRGQTYASIYSTDPSNSQLALLDKANFDEGAELNEILSEYFNMSCERIDGFWWLTDTHKQKHSLFDHFEEYTYHTGGIAGNNGTLKENELLAKLEQGEAIISNAGKENLFKTMEFMDTLSRVDFSSVFAENLLPNQPSEVLKGATADLNAVSSTQNHSVQIGDVIIYGGNEDTVAKHQEITRDFTNQILKQLNLKR